MKICSRANRYTDGLDSTTNLPTDTTADTPESEPDLITDTRHSFGMELGNRWVYHGIAWGVGVSIGKIIDRKVAVSSSDENARTDYESASNRLINSIMSLVPVPELSFGLGFAF